MFYYQKKINLLKAVLIKEHNKQIEKHFNNMFIK